MPRIARVVVPGIPHHITQRGNYRQLVFREDEDRERYLQWVREYSNRYYLTVWGCTLMDNHVHFIAVPQNSDSLVRTFNPDWREYLSEPEDEEIIE
jgi:putative transposase